MTSSGMLGTLDRVIRERDQLAEQARKVRILCDMATLAHRAGSTHCPAAVLATDVLDVLDGVA